MSCSCGNVKCSIPRNTKKQPWWCRHVKGQVAMQKPINVLEQVKPCKIELGSSVLLSLAGISHSTECRPKQARQTCSLECAVLGFLLIEILQAPASHPWLSGQAVALAPRCHARPRSWLTLEGDFNNHLNVVPSRFPLARLDIRTTEPAHAACERPHAPKPV